VSGQPGGRASAAARGSALRALLAEAGIPAEAAVAGFRQEVAVVVTSAAHLPGVEALAARIRGLGFRYVTVDLERLARPDA
jgi:hypothetical protein